MCDLCVFSIQNKIVVMIFMEKKEFLNLAKKQLVEFGFHKVRNKNFYYMENPETHSVVAVYLDGSRFTAGYYVECCIYFNDENQPAESLTFYDMHLIQRVCFSEGYCFEYGKQTAELFQSCLSKKVNEYLLPALENGKKYVLSHPDTYLNRLISIKCRKVLGL